MSSMRNAVQRRQHRERAQPEAREKWGILEKHKDYSLRAADYNAKKAKLRRLREKAQDRNPDEFAFGMIFQKGGKQIRQGRHGARPDATLSMETVRLLKTQDAGYLRTMGEQVRRKMEAVEREVRLQDGIGGALNDKKDRSERNSGRKLVFVDSADEQRQRSRRKSSDGDGDGDAESQEEGDGHEDEGNAAAQSQTEKKSRKQLEQERLRLKEVLDAKKLKRKAAESRVKRLEALKKQHKDIVAAEQELDWQRGRMENSVGGVNKNGVKWKVRERKR